MFGAEPMRVSGVLERDPEFGTDRLASAIMEFSGGQAMFTCSTQMVPYQRMQFLGSAGRIEIEIPFNAPTNKATRIFVDDGSDVGGAGIKVETIPACDQYTIQGDIFSKAMLEDSAVPVPLEDAIANMTVIDAIFRSAESGKWEKPAG
jgi:predicted dehydrogenase